ncbi:MAG: cobalt ECF transporter T component CbiQ [Lachnospiraceae bacterium]
MIKLAWITGILAAVVMVLLFYGKMKFMFLLIIAIVVGCLMGHFGAHEDQGNFLIDQIAHKSKLNKLNPTIKFLYVFVLLVICIASDYKVGLFLMLGMLFVTVCVGGISLHEYIELLLVPISFVLFSSVALLFEYAQSMDGIWGISVFGGYLYISEFTQERCLLVTCRAMGALSCLYFLNLSTTMYEMIQVFRKLKVPKLIIELMYLIYRYAFVLIETYQKMRDSAKSRMGYSGLNCSVRTTGILYSNLLGSSYKKANMCFDALESRCYDGDILFLEDEKKIEYKSIVMLSIIVLVALLVSLIG